MKKFLIILLFFIAIVSVIIFIYINKNNENKLDMSYEIVTDYNTIQTLSIDRSSKKGYEIIEEDSFYYLVIHAGEQPSYFNELEVTSVEIDGNNIKVKVALPNAGAGDAFSYPRVIIKLNQKPNKININNYTYKKI